MKILYAIQATGNGHLTRAREILPALQERVEVDVLISGIQAEFKLPFPVKYQLHGLSFIFGKNGGIDLLNTYRQMEMKRFLNEVNRLPVREYDLIISDFEPVSCWAAWHKDVPCAGLSNQLAIFSKDAPQAKHEDPLGKFILKHYAPCNTAYGLHFQRYNEKIFTPVIRKEIRELEISDRNYYLVYLPAYSDERIQKVLELFPDKQWVVFSKKSRKGYTYKNIEFLPVMDGAFLKRLAECSGILCAAGFGTPSEALYLGKKLMVIPMKNQFEQQCNAVALKKLGVHVIKSLKKKHEDKIYNWIMTGEAVKMEYSDNREEIVDTILSDFYRRQIPAPQESFVLEQNVQKVWKIFT